MQEIFQLYSKVYENKSLTPEMLRNDIESVKNITNMWVLEMLYSFFMLGYNTRNNIEPVII